MRTNDLVDKMSSGCLKVHLKCADGHHALAMKMATHYFVNNITASFVEAVLYGEQHGSEAYTAAVKILEKSHAGEWITMQEMYLLYTLMRDFDDFTDEAGTSLVESTEEVQTH